MLIRQCNKSYSDRNDIFLAAYDLTFYTESEIGETDAM